MFLLVACQHMSGACQSHSHPVLSLREASRKYVELSPSTPPFLTLQFHEKDLTPTPNLLRIWPILPPLGHILSVTGGYSLSQQITEFKMAKGNMWEKTFQGKYPQNQVKFMGTFTCPCFRTNGESWSDGCKYKQSHVPAYEILDNKKEAYNKYMVKCKRKFSIK
jgi:hypothetical protein